MNLKNKTFVIAIATGAALVALIGYAADSKSGTGSPGTSTQVASSAKTTVTTTEWTTDFDAALKKAKAERKSVLLDFTGSDWCGWCMRLDREIFATPEFKKFAGKHLVLVKIDFPRHKSQSDAEKAQNEQLAARFQVQGFPTLVVLDPDAKPSGTLGYMRGGPEPFINQLSSLIAK
jgi:protein disulfide-isomerase